MTGAREPEPTRAIELGDTTQPVEVSPPTGPFARTTPPSRPIPLVSHTAANELIGAAVDAPMDEPGIDSLFGEDRFQEYEVPSPPAPAPVRAIAADPPHMTPTHRVLLAVAGALVGLLGIAALFFLGVRISTAATTSTPDRAASSSSSRAAAIPSSGPVPVGTHRWDQLLGGECLKAFPGPWAERYTVVDCATPHPAQLVFRGRLPDPATSGYPGQAALQSQMSTLCSAPDAIDLAAAAPYSDAQVEASYPVTAAQWDAGDHAYYCFVLRSSGQPLTGSLAASRSG